MLTVANLQTNLAYRLGETSAPTDATLKAQRLEWMNMAYFNLARRMNWWWLEGSSVANTNTGSAIGYSEPTDLKEFIELKISNIFYQQIPYKDHQIYENTLGVVSLPSLRRSFKFYRFGGKYYLIPVDGADAAIHYIKYYKRPTKATDDTSTFLLPDEFAEAITAFAEGRYWMSIFQQAKAAAPFQEFEEIVQELTKEQGRRGWGSEGFGMREPEDVIS